jgi:hypothetical protein
MAMNPDLVVEFDAARQALDAFAAASTEEPASIEARLARDMADLKMHGLDGEWHQRWIRMPLRAIRAIEGLRLHLMVELEDVRHELRAVEAELSLLREAGVRDNDQASRRAVRLLCHEADLRERLATPIASTIPLARDGVARVLEVSLRHAGREALLLARESAAPGADPALHTAARELVEDYNRFVVEAQGVTGGINLGVFLPDYVERVRGAPWPASAAAPSPPAERALLKPTSAAKPASPLPTTAAASLPKPTNARAV